MIFCSVLLFYVLFFLRLFDMRFYAHPGECA
jgi:hypothetical protein